MKQIVLQLMDDVGIVYKAIIISHSKKGLSSKIISVYVHLQNYQCFSSLSSKVLQSLQVRLKHWISRHSLALTLMWASLQVFVWIQSGNYTFFNIIALRRGTCRFYLLGPKHLLGLGTMVGTCSSCFTDSWMVICAVLSSICLSAMSSASPRSSLILLLWG